LDLLREPLNALYELEFTYLQLDYYCGKNNSFALELTSDNTSQAPLIFVCTSTGFQFYSVTETGENLLCYSETTGEKKGIIYIPDATEDSPSTTITYQFGNEKFSIQVEKDTLYFSINYSVLGEQIDFDITIVADNFSIISKVTGNQSCADVGFTFASYGQKLASFNIKSTLRDYNNVLPPTEALDTDTWISRLNYNAMSQNLALLEEKLPVLQDLFSTREENDFSDMTGYSVDENGYVDFEPLDSEVFAKNRPSTGFQQLTLSDDTKNTLLTYAAGCFYFLFLLSLLTLLICRSKSPEFISSASTYCSNTGTVQE